MISDLNKIYIKGGVKVNQNTMPILCFIDGKAVDNRMYSLVNRELNIYKESTEYITLTYGYNDAKVYNFNVVLDNFGTIIEKYDMNGEWLQGLSPNKLLVFVDGRLLEDYEYELLTQDAASTLIYSVESTPYPSVATVEQTQGDSLSDLTVDVEILEENFSPTHDYIGEFTYKDNSSARVTVGFEHLTDLVVDFAEFNEQIQTAGTYEFIYNGTKWTLDNQEIDNIAEYGISYVGNPIANDKITINIDANAHWEHYREPVNLSLYGISYTGIPLNNDKITLTYTYGDSLGYNDVHVNKSIFETQTRTTGVYSFTYNGENWLISDSSVVVELSDYGITVSKRPNTNDIITITYTAEKNSAIALRFRIPGDDFHSVVIYSCKTNLDIDYFNAPSGTTIPCSYNRDRYLIFKNGYLIPNKDIYVSTGNESIIINHEYTSDDVIKYVVLPNSTQTLNFATERGFLTYGPDDDYFKTLPLDYNYELVFEDNVVNIIDDIRTGFILASDEYNTEFLIVDDNFNKNKIKALGLNNPIARYYRDGEFYLLVPECRKITEYLSDFDKSGKLIPEILEVFQRFLLDEFHDEIQRLRNIRNLSKVDSLHIDKLLKFLGSKIDLKNKSLLQKRAILEELTSFYRILGTKNSYNIFNISDTSIGLENLEQLFTIRNNASPNSKKTITKIITNINQGGLGYKINEQYLLKDQQDGKLTNVKVKVTNTDNYGQITSIAPQVNETIGELDISTGYYDIVSVGDNACFDVKSNGYSYNYTCDPSTDLIGISERLPLGQSMLCQVEGYPGSVTFTKDNMDYNTIRVNLSQKKGTDPIGKWEEDDREYYLKNAKVTRNIDNISCTIHSAIQYSDAYIFDNGTPSDAPYTIKLQPGFYFYEMSGGGGAGGAADSTVGDTADIPSENGYNGEFLSGTFYIAQESVVKIYVGGGAKGSYARGHTPYDSGDPGIGYHSGAKGTPIRVQRKWIWFEKYDTIATGSGGGSSAILINNSLEREARGGNGGNCVSTPVINVDTESQGGKNITYYGGNGGGGSYRGVNNGGAQGGNHSVADNTFTSTGGGNGWVKIKKANINYILTLDNLYNEHVSQGVKFKTSIFSSLLASSVYVTVNSQTLSNVQINKKVFENKLHPTEDGIYIFKYNGFSWVFNDTPNTVMSEYGITYQGVPDTGNTITVKYTYSKNNGEFEVEITGYDSTRNIITQYDYSPKSGENVFTQKNGRLLINSPSNGTDVNAILFPYDTDMFMNIHNVGPEKFNYNLSLNEILSSLATVEQTQGSSLTGLNVNKETLENNYPSISNYTKIFEYDGSGWVYDSEYVNLSNYGISYVGTPHNNDEITLIYIASNISRNYHAGDILKFASGNQSLNNFQIYVDEVNLSGEIKRFHFTPTTGTDPIESLNTPTTMQNGSGGVLFIEAQTQTLAEANTIKEYVDFFTKEELGAVHHTEYRLNVTDYGLVSEGTPNSPYPWTMGEPDEDFGVTINEGGLVTQDRDYGYVKDPVKGKWYQWWEWERDPNYYPTNHIEVTLSPKSSSALNDSLERFFSQFYKIASTVLYIHRVIANYRFGNETIFSINEDGTVNGSILFGFMSGQPIPYETHFLTSDPNRQSRT